MMSTYAQIKLCFTDIRNSQAALKDEAQNNLFRIANHNTIERFCYLNGKMICSMFILNSLELLIFSSLD